MTKLCPIMRRIINIKQVEQIWQSTRMLSCQTRATRDNLLMVTRESFTIKSFNMYFEIFLGRHNSSWFQFNLIIRCSDQLVSRVTLQKSWKRNSLVSTSLNLALSGWCDFIKRQMPRWRVRILSS